MLGLESEARAERPNAVKPADNPVDSARSSSRGAVGPAPRADAGSGPASNRSLEFFENELCRLMGIEDSATCTLVAIETYCGRIPTSRKAAVDLLNPRTAP